jgi:hypothetical protein
MDLRDPSLVRYAIDAIQPYVDALAAPGKRPQVH